MDQRTTDQIVREDVETLHRFGYAQELSRRMSAFSNFALSFLIIGLYWASALNMQQGISTAGMIGISGIFLGGCVVALATAMSLGEISSAIPTAGGLYHWSSALGGRGWGWATAWVNLLAYIFSVAGTAVATYLLFNQMILGWIFNIDTSAWGYWEQLAGVALIVGTQALLNHVGVRVLTGIGDFGAYITFAGAVVLFGLMLLNIHPANFAHMFDYQNMTGDPGGGVVPHTDNVYLIVGYAFLLPMWIITSYDASAHTSEETVDARRSVPRAMVNSVLFSAGMGLLLFTIFGLAMQDQNAIIKQGGNAFTELWSEIHAPALLKDFVPVTMFIAAYICGAFGLTGCSRAVFAFSRDGGMPKVMRRISHRFRTPAPAIWMAALVCVLVTLYSSAFNALVAGTALFYQLCYGMAIAAAMFSRNRTYGPYRLGIWSKPLNVVSILGGVYLIWVGLQPPTDILITYFAGIIIVLLVAWFAVERKRFAGPPLNDAAIKGRQMEIHDEEVAVGEIA